MNDPFDFSDFEGEIKDMDHLKATIQTMKNTIEATGKDRDYWKEQAKDRLLAFNEREDQIQQFMLDLRLAVIVVVIFTAIVAFILGGVIF